MPHARRNGTPEAAPAQRLEELVQHLCAEGRQQTLRRFAARLARELAPQAPAGAEALTQAAEQAARDEAVDLEAIRAEHASTAMAAGTVGLSHGAANAAALLAAFQACRPDACMAAHQTSRMALRHAELSGNDAGEAARRYVDSLSDLMEGD